VHQLEPFYTWVDIYNEEDDELSPFFGKTHSEFEFTNSVYNYLIHPQWDNFGSPTLYIKILYADYDKNLAVIEMIGEWNDCITNDIMYLKREVIEVLIENGINKFVLIGENVLNFHYSDDCYYEEWYEEIKEQNGWIALVNFRDHVLAEFKKAQVLNYVYYNQEIDYLEWRKQKPFTFHKFIEESFGNQSQLED
jgi:hypothetical protein